MKVIIRDEIKLGSSGNISVMEYNENEDIFLQLKQLIVQEINWLGNIEEAKIGAFEIDDFEEYDYEKDDDNFYLDEAHVFAGDYSIHFYVRDVEPALERGMI